MWLVGRLPVGMPNATKLSELLRFVQGSELAEIMGYARLHIIACSVIHAPLRGTFKQNELETAY